jgi:aspartate racemase
MDGTRSVLAVRDLRASTAYYVDVLGFTRDFGDGTDGWSFLSRDGFKVMLGECPDARDMGNHSWFAYITVGGIDALHRELVERGATVIAGPVTEPWGMREFGIRTPDGHRIRFGEPVEPSTLRHHAVRDQETSVARGRPLMKTIGIVAHSAEGGALCFLSACREGQALIGAHMHPDIVVSAIPMGLSMPGWEGDDHDLVARHLRRGVEIVAAAGADFFICPDNTAHIVLETIAGSLPIPGLHIADVVAHEMAEQGHRKAALLGTKWTMTGRVYPEALARRGFERVIPDEATRATINDAIFEELCQGVFEPDTTRVFVEAIDALRLEGADCAILGCTEIPLIVSHANSPLPVLDSTRLLASYAVREAVSERLLAPLGGWLTPASYKASRAS